jgi:hypothetical protein
VDKRPAMLSLFIVITLGVFGAGFFVFAVLLQFTEHLVQKNKFTQDHYLLMIVLYTLGFLFVLLLLGYFRGPRVEREADKLVPPSDYVIPVDIQDPDSPKAVLISIVLSVGYFYTVLVLAYPTGLEPLELPLIVIFGFVFGIVVVTFFYGFWRLTLQKPPLRLWLYTETALPQSKLLGLSTVRAKSILPEALVFSLESGAKAYLMVSTWFAGRGSVGKRQRRVYQLFLITKAYVFQISFPFFALTDKDAPVPLGIQVIKTEPAKPWGAHKFVCSAPVSTGNLLDSSYVWFIERLRQLS